MKEHKDGIFLQGGGAMGEAVRSIDWALTPLGPVAQWPHALKIAAGIMLANPFPMYIAWGSEYIQLYNDGFRPILGTTKHPQALSISSKETFSEIWSTIGPMFEGVMEGKAVGFSDFTVTLNRHGYPEECFFDFAYSPISDESGTIGGILVTVIETTEKYKAGLALKTAKDDLEQAHYLTEKERERLHLFFMQAPAGICILDGPDLVFELVNPAYQQLFPGRDLLGKPLLMALPEITGQPICAILNNVYNNNEAFVGNELKVPLPATANGHLEDRYFNFIYQPRHTTGGEVDGIMVFVYEVTEMIKTKQQLAESEKRLRSIVEQSPVPMMVTKGEEMIFTEFNPPMLQLLNKDMSIKGKSTYEILSELKGQPILDILLNTYKTGESWTGYEYPIMMEKDGHMVQGYFNLSYKPFIENNKVAGVLQSAIDVTEQVLARKALEKAEDTLKLSLEAARLGSFDLDLVLNQLYWDDRCRELFGISHHDDVNYQKDFVEGLHPDDRERILDIINNETTIKAISNGHYDVEYRTVGASDGKLRWLRAMGKVYFDANDKPLRFIGTVIDITEKKEDELRKNDFIGMVSHELKTPLTSLKAYLQILQQDDKSVKNDFEKTMLTKAEAQVNKMNHLVNGFLNVSRLEAGKIALHIDCFDLVILLEEVIEDIKLTSYKHQIIFETCPPVLVKADRDKIGSVVTNLLTNAIKYSPPDTLITLTCHHKENRAIVAVKDFGIGIKLADQQRLFERFYRVEDNDHKKIAGFGIGLYLSAEIIHRHSGTIYLESEIGKGTTFTFTLLTE